MFTLRRIRESGRMEHDNTTPAVDTTVAEETVAEETVVEATVDETILTTPEPQAARTGRWTRPQNGRLLAGVAAGLAEKTELPAWLVRAGFVITSFAGGFGVAAYLAAWALMPSEGTGKALADDLRARLDEADTPSKRVGVGLIGLGVFVALASTGLLSSPLTLAALLVLAGVALIRPTTNHN